MTNVHWQWVWFRLSECIIVIDRFPKETWFSLRLGIFVIDRGQWQICMNTEFDLDSVSAYLSLIAVNDKYAWTLTLIQTQWVHICHWSQSMTNVHWQWVWFRLSECIIVIDRFPKETWFSLRLGIFVIDRGQWQICMNTEFDLDSVSAYLSLIAVNDKCAGTLSVI